MSGRGFLWRFALKRSLATTGAGLDPVKIDRRKVQNLVKFASWTFEGSGGEDAPLKSMDPSRVQGLVLSADEGERPAGQKADGQHEEAAGGVDRALEDGERHGRIP